MSTTVKITIYFQSDCSLFNQGGLHDVKMIITFETDKSDVMIHKNYDVKMSLMSKSPRVKLPIFVRSFIFMIQIFAKKNYAK